MFVSERSALARELRKPLPRPKEVTTQTYSRWSERFTSGLAHPRWHLPEAIAPNSDFIPRLLHDFYNFCEDHIDRGNDPRRLTALQVAREECALAVLGGQVSTIRFLTGEIFPSLTRALRDLEQNTALGSGGYITEPMDGYAGIHIVFEDGASSVFAPRAVFQAKPSNVGHDYFPEMDRMAQERVKFTSGIYKEHLKANVTVGGELSIILSVSSHLVYACYKLTLAFRGPYKRTTI
jgi:hypothetical protein